MSGHQRDAGIARRAETGTSDGAQRGQQAAASTGSHAAAGSSHAASQSSETSMMQPMRGMSELHSEASGADKSSDDMQRDQPVMGNGRRDHDVDPNLPADQKALGADESSDDMQRHQPVMADGRRGHNVDPNPSSDQKGPGHRVSRHEKEMQLNAIVDHLLRLTGESPPTTQV